MGDPLPRATLLLCLGLAACLCACADPGTTAGSADSLTSDALADGEVAATGASITARGARYLRVDWTGRFEFEACGADEAVVRIAWGDGYEDKLDLRVVALPLTAEGCRLFKTSHIYGAVGPAKVAAKATWPDGKTRSSELDVEILAAPPHTPQHSSPMALAAPYAVVVSKDSDQLVMYERSTSQEWLFKQRVNVCKTPRTLSANGNFVAVTCQGDDRVRVLKINNGAVQSQVQLPRGSRPYGVVWPHAIPGQQSDLYVTLQATGQVVRLIDNGGGKVVLADAVTAVTDARGIAALPDGRLAVSRWRSPEKNGEVAVLDWAKKTSTIVPIAFADLAPADSESGGVPSYLDMVLVQPDGKRVLLPGTHANNRDGTFRNNTALQHDSSVRAMIARVALPSLKDSVANRWILENRGLAGAGAFTPDGAWLFVAMRGSRSLERFDLIKGVQSGTMLDVGYAPEAVGVTKDGRWLLVLSALSRRFQTYRLPAFGPLPKAPTKSYALVDDEPLSAEVLRGKQLFNDSFDPRLAADGYIACAHCHLDGEADGRTWDFTDRGEGMRNTPSLHGRAGMGHGPVHWSANFDEIQDFEHDIRGPFGGTGLLSDDDFAATDTTMGAKKAGRSKDLDALAAYVASLQTYPKSPARKPDGGMTAAATRGEALFKDSKQGCTGCHSGPHLTDSKLTNNKPTLHDVGTLTAASGKRLNASLEGIDTPTLHGLSNTAPYLHDGSAPTLTDVLVARNKGDKHGKTSHLSAADVADLVAYLQQLEGP